MKKILFILVLMPSALFAQLRGFSQKEFPKLEIIAMAAKTASDTYLLGGNVNNLPPVFLNETFEKYCDTLSVKPNPYGVFKDAISKMYLELGSGAQTYKPSFIANETGAPSLFDYKNASKVLVFHTLTYESTFNVLKLNESERASRMATDVLLPAIYKVAKEVPTAIKYFGIAVAYGSKDFSEKNEFPKSDWLLIVVPTSMAKDYANCYITEEELLEKSDIYLSPRDYFSLIKKIKLEIK